MRTPLKVLSPCRRAPATASGMSRRNVFATWARVTESPVRVQVPARLASKSATPGFEAGTNSRPVVPPSAPSVRSTRDPRASWAVVTPAWGVAKLDARECPATESSLGPPTSFRHAASDVAAAIQAKQRRYRMVLLRGVLTDGSNPRSGVFQGRVLGGYSSTTAVP